MDSQNKTTGTRLPDTIPATFVLMHYYKQVLLKVWLGGLVLYPLPPSHSHSVVIYGPPSADF
jgi:hypothetical protein